MKALDEIFIFSFAPFQISELFQDFFFEDRTARDFCTIFFATFDALFVDFQRTRNILQIFVKISPIFVGIEISHNNYFSDFDRSDAKIAIFQRNVK